MWYSVEITKIENNEIKVKFMKRCAKNTFTLTEDDHYRYKNKYNL